MTAIHVYFGPDALTAPPVVRKMRLSDAFFALAEGFDDFTAMPSHLFFLPIFYAGAGIALAAMSSFGGALHLVFPLAAGFALVGPFLAVGLYELSRRRELGMDVKLADSFIVANSPAMPSLAILGLALVAIFAAWIASAQALYVSLYGPAAPSSAHAFLSDVVSTDRGLRLIALGGGVGFVFAALVLCVSVVSFPLMLDRDIGLVPAVATSLRVCWKNPLVVATWGVIVAGLLILGTLPLFIGLAVVMPVLGHATWRFYRRAVERDPAHEQHPHWPDVATKPAHYYATPHSVLFPLPPSGEK
ncbi:MAG: DUF2189 domain-containing protein [Pseudomonadota bacterium]|nr:DUF2189 domain-containing protein [Pseudomonadota bacterium]